MGRHFSGRPLDDGLHEAGCFYGGPDGEGYWFAVAGCPLAHDGDVAALVGTEQGAREAWAYAEQIGMTTTGEQ